jgi:murein hydrolase activator
MTQGSTILAGMARRSLAIFAALGLAALQPAAAQQNELKDIERALRKDRNQAQELMRQAADLAREIQALQVESISAARVAQDNEARLSALETQLADLESREAEKVAALTARRSQLGLTLGALQRIALQPSDALLLSPAPPIDTVRSGMLLRAAIPAIEARATALRAELNELTALRTQIAARRSQLSETAAALTADRGRLSALIERKRQVRVTATEGQKAARERAARLAARAKDLRELMERVERESAKRELAERTKRKAAERAKREAEQRAAQAQAAKAASEARAREQATRRAEADKARKSAPPAAPNRQAEAPSSAAPAPGAQVALAQPPNIRPFPSTGQSLIIPARGKMKTRFGQTQSDGRAARGIVIAARKGAQVVAPYDGKVVYAGEFRSYGQILIIEHGGRYHTLLAGLGRVDAVVGQWLLAGEPVGILGGTRGSAPELYLELRHAGQPINPLPWLATTGDKVRG